MARTALDLSPAELRNYRPDRNLNKAPPKPYLDKAMAIAHAAAKLLRDDFGATRVVIFGSLAHQRWFGPASDIDLAVQGIPPHQFFRAVAAVTNISSPFQIDIVDLEDCSPSLRGEIEKEGIAL